MYAACIFLKSVTHYDTIKKRLRLCQSPGRSAGTRTLDPLIKSHTLASLYSIIFVIVAEICGFHSRTILLRQSPPGSYNRSMQVRDLDRIFI